MKNIIKNISISIFASTFLFGASIPNSSDILRQTEKPKLPQKESVLPEIKTQAYKAPMIADSNIIINIKGFKITGNTIFTQDELLALISSYINKEVTFKQLNEAMSIITKYYRDKGYFVARAYIPVQEFDKSNAIVEITIIEGTYGNFEIKNSSNVSTDVIKNYLDKLSNKEVISQSSLEKEMMLIDDLKGAKVKDVQILKGKQVGTSDFAFEVDSEPKYSGYAILDNYGSRYTGKNRLNIIQNINSISNRGDALELNALTSNNGNLKNAKVGYNIPLGYNGLMLDTSLAYSTYKIGEEFKDLDIQGKSTKFNIGASYPIKKTKNETLKVSMSYNNNISKDKDNYQDDRKKTVNSIALSLNHTKKTKILNKIGQTQSVVSLISGNLKLNDYSKSIDTLNTDGTYSKVNASISHIQALAQNFSATATFSGQLALNKNLDGSEDFSVGGANGMRAYTDSELSGDKGYMANIEFSYILPSFNGLNHTISTFLDHSKVWNNKEATVGAIVESRILNDIGIGYSLEYKDFMMKSQYAHGFGPDKTPTGNGDNTNLNRLSLQAILMF